MQSKLQRKGFSLFFSFFSQENKNVEKEKVTLVSENSIKGIIVTVHKRNTTWVGRRGLNFPENFEENGDRVHAVEEAHGKGKIQHRAPDGESERCFLQTVIELWSTSKGR